MGEGKKGDRVERKRMEGCKGNGRKIGEEEDERGKIKGRKYARIRRRGRTRDGERK